jgi:hypothetical protein
MAGPGDPGRATALNENSEAAMQQANVETIFDIPSPFLDVLICETADLGRRCGNGAFRLITAPKRARQVYLRRKCPSVGQLLQDPFQVQLDDHEPDFPTDEPLHSKSQHLPHFHRQLQLAHVAP